MKAQAAKKVRGPSEQKRQDSETWVWGEVTDNTGRQVSSILKTPNGYTLTALAALGVVNKLMAAQRPIGGFYTPSRLMGADYVLRLQGFKRLSATK